MKILLFMSVLLLCGCHHVKLQEVTPLGPCRPGTFSVDGPNISMTMHRVEKPDGSCVWE